MTGRWRAAALLALLAGPAAAQTGDAVALLLRQGQRWLDQNRPDLAASSVDRVLAAEPANAEALALAARIALARGQRDAAAGYAAKLRASGAAPAVIASTDSALRAPTIDRAAIEDARRLARDGHADDAVARYRAAFGGSGEPPEPFAREFFQTLNATRTGRDAGQRGLAQLAAQPGADDATRLANAQALTYAPATRADGINQLATLAGRPDAAAEARRAWKQALGFYGDDPQSIPLLQAFLRRFPDDADMQARLRSAQATQSAALAATPPADPNDALRRTGFAALNTNTLAPAAAQFEAALAANPNDSDALGGLGIVRLRQNRAGDARALLERAVAADPAHADRWRAALDGAAYSTELADSRALLRRGDVAGADATVARALIRTVEDRTDAETLAGEVALRRGDPAGAEAHFRTALARRPGFATATAGLAAALRAQGRLPPEPVRAPRPPAGNEDEAAPNSRAGQLRAQANRADDPLLQASLLNEAVAAAPNDPWIRLDLARVLRRLGRAGEGRALVEELAARTGAADPNYAAALLAQESGRPADAEAFLARIPPQRRSADMARLSARVRTEAEIASAAALLPSAPLEARQRLVQFAARPDPTGQTAAAAVRALGEAGDRVGASEAARIAGTVNRAPAARLAVGGALLSAGLVSDANAAAARLDGEALTPSQRRDLGNLRTGAAIRASDQFNESGDQAAGFEQLRPALAANPTAPEVQLALARLYDGAREPRQAARIADAVLARNPRNWDARGGAVDAALAAGERRRAAVLADDGAALAPGDSRATLLQARVARAGGNAVQARALLERAATERQAELGTQPEVASAVPAANPFGRTAAAPATASPADPVARQIATELAAARAEAAPTAGGGVNVRYRSGTAGLDQLQEVSAPIQASFVPGSLGGRVTARATPVSLDAGALPSTGQTPYRYGTNAAAGRAVLPGGQSATGAALNVGYTRGDTFSVDAGSTPLGFPVTTVVGGVEVAPRLGESLTLRLKAERRSVLDSLLSYGGQKDAITGQSWGGVTQSGGHAQLEFAVGEGSAYVGGGYSVYDGRHVRDNTKIEGGGGFSYPFFKQGDTTVSSGLDVVYFRFDNNQRGFTLGQGGYFSPQNFVAANIPIDYRSRYGALRYHLGVVAGIASFREDASVLFPLDPALQAQAEANALTNSTIPTRNQAQSRNGFVGGVRVDVGYPLSETLMLTAGGSYDRAAQWQETKLAIRLENRF